MASVMQLGDLVRIEKGKKASQIFDRPSASTRPYLQIDDLRPDAKRKFVEPFACPVASKTDVVIAWDGANAGTVSCNLDGYIGSTLAVLRPSTQQLFAPYLSRFLEGKFDYLQKNSTGATVPHVSRDVLESLELPLPSLSEQQRIAGQLEQADSLRRTRRYALELSDSFLPAAFLELFGDPVKNKQRWQTVPLREMCDNITDGTHDTPGRVTVGIPFLTSKNIRPYEIDLTNLDFVTPETHREIIKRCNPRFGDVLYTNIGVNVGNAVANRLRFEFSLKNVALIQPDFTRLNSAFLEALLNNSAFKESILRVSSVGGAQKFIALEVLRDIVAILPPLPLQQKFAALVERHEHLRATQREALRQAEHLFQTLLHQAFSAGV